MTQLIPSYMFFAGVAILGVTFAYYIKKGSKNQKRIWDEFWDREQKASTVTKREFPDQFLLNFTIDGIPEPPSEAFTHYHERILIFLDMPMVSLTQYSNLELKETFGVNHFQKLIRYEETFDNFVACIKEYINQLESHGFSEQKERLEYYYHQVLKQVELKKSQKQ